MSYYSTTHSTLLFNLTTYTTLLGLENASLSTPDSNITTTLETIFEGPPSSPYNVTQKVIIAIVFTALSFLTVMGNFMVSWTYNFIKALSMPVLPLSMAIVTEEILHLMHAAPSKTEAFPSTPWQLFRRHEEMDGLLIWHEMRCGNECCRPDSEKLF